MSALVALFIGLQKALIQCASIVTLSVTQVILPVAIISTVVVVRHVSPPEAIAPCQYRSTSLPSDGTLSFLQSFGCNLDNECLPPNYTETPQELKARNRFRRLDESVAPIISNATKMAKITKLPIATAAIIKLGKAAADNNLTGLLDSFDLTIGSLFYNESMVVRFLVDEARVLTRPAAEALMRGRLNLTALMGSFGGGSGIMDIVCDPAQLTAYLSINYEGDKNATVVRQISSALCSLDPAKASNISDFLFSQFNIGKALGLFRQVADFTYNYNLTLALTDLETLVKLIPKFDVLSSLNRGLVSQWAVSLVQQLQKLLSEPGLLSDLSFISQTAEQLMSLIAAIVDNHPTAKAHLEEAKKFLGSGQRLLGAMLHLQTMMLDSTLDKLLPPEVLSYLASRGVSAAALRDTPITLSGLFYLMQVDAGTSDQVVAQLCTGGSELKSLFTAPASYPELLNQVQHFLCSNSTALASMAKSVNLTHFLQQYYTAGATLNMTQLVMDVAKMVHLTSSNNTIVAQVIAIVTDPSWRFNRNATKEEIITGVATMGTVKMLEAVLDQILQQEPLRSQALLVANLALLEVETLKMQPTMEQEFGNFLLKNATISQWVDNSATALPGVLVQQSLLTVPLHAYSFAYTHGLSNRAELQRILCEPRSLQDVVDANTAALLSAGGPTANATLQLFCTSADVFVTACDFLKGKQDQIMARAAQLASRPASSFAILSSIVETFHQWLQLQEQQQQDLVRNGPWLTQTVEQLASRVNTTCDAKCLSSLASCQAGMALYSSLLPQVAGYHFMDKASPPGLDWWPVTINSMVANMNMQAAAYFLANSFAIPARRDALLRFAQSPQAATALGLTFQLFLEVHRSPPTNWELTTPPRPLCNGSWLLDSLPTLRSYPAGVKLNATFCELFASTANPYGDEHLRMFATALASVRSMLNGYNVSAGDLAESLLSIINQNQLLSYAITTGAASSSPELTTNGTGAAGAATVGSMELPLHIASLVYELFYSAATSNATDPAVASVMREINFQVVMQQGIYEFIWQLLHQLNTTRDLQRAVLDTSELAELTASVPAAMQDLLRAAVDGLLTVAPQSIGLAINRSSVLCTDYQPASIFGAAANLTSVRRFGDALCAAIEKLPASAMARFGPLMQLFDPARRAELSAAKANLSSLLTLNEQISSLMMGLVRLQVTDLLPGAINITDWVEFGNKFAADTNAMFTANLTSTLQRYGQMALNQLQADPTVGPMVREYLSSTTQLITQITDLLKASNSSATVLVSDTELANFVALFNQVPALLPTLLRTAFEMHKDPSMAMRWQPVFANPGLLCSNMSTFTQLLRTPDGVDPAVLQQDLCRVMSFNATALMGQLFQRLPALSRIIEQATCLATGCRPSGAGSNATSAEFFGAIQTAAVEFQSLLAKFGLGNIRMEIFNSTYMALLLGPELQHFTSIGNGTVDSQLIQRYLATYAHLVNSLMSSANVTSINLDVLVRMLEWHQALLELLLAGPARLETMLSGTTDGQRLWRMVASLPAVVQTLVNTATHHQMRLIQLQEDLVSALKSSTTGSVWTALCRLNFTELFIVPPGVSFDPEAFRADMCSLNLTTMENLPPQLRTLLSMPGTGTVTPEALIRAINITSSAASNWTAIQHVWMPFVNEWSTVFANITPATPSIELAYHQLDASLVYLPVEAYQPVANVLSLTYYLLDLATASVNRLLASNSTSPADALYQLPETQKLLRLISENFTDVVVAGAYNQRPLQFLLTRNQTEAFMYLCLSQNATLMAAMGMSDFKFTSPPGLCVGCIIERLCELNITALVQETNELSGSLTNSWTARDPRNFTFVQLGHKVTQLQLLVMQLASRNTLQLPGSFQAANWNAAIKLLTEKYGNDSTIAGNAQELLLTFYLSLKDPNTQAAFAAVLSGVLDQWVPRLEALLASKNLYEMFKGLPLLDALYNITARDGGVAVLNVVLQAAVRNPSRLAELILSPAKAADAFGQLCNGTLDLASILTINASSDTRSVQRALCTVMSDVSNVDKLSVQLIYHLGLSSVFPGGPPLTDNATANLTEIQARAQALFVTVQSLLMMSPTDLLPSINLTVYSQLFLTNHYKSTQQMVLGYYSTLYSLLKTYLPTAEFQRVQDVISSSMFFLDALTDYTSATFVGPGQVDLSQLVANISSAETLLHQLLQPHNLTGLQVITSRLPELYGIVMANASVLCSVDLSRYFVLPESLNASQLQGSICRLASNFQTQVMANLNIVRLMQATSGFSTPNQTLTFDRLWQLYSKLYNSTVMAMVANVTVTYRGIPVAHLLRLDGLPSLQTVFPDVVTTAGQMEL